MILAIVEIVEYPATVQQPAPVNWYFYVFPAVNSVMNKVTIVTIWDVLQHALFNQLVVQNN